MPKIELAIGPMSSEIIEAIFRYSHENKSPLMIIASKNQIDHNGGYVNNWTTGKFMDFIVKMREKYPQNKVMICRDHCGPGFNGIYDLEDTYKTIEEDIRNGFDLIHIDFCHYQGTREEILNESKKAIEYCLKLNPEIKLEIGTDENDGGFFNTEDLEQIESTIDFFKEFCDPEFYVLQTGSLVKEIRQVGGFNREFIKKASDLITSKTIKLKEHNADYLPKDKILLREGLVHGMNIAPQLGVCQTFYVFKKCLQYGIVLKDFVDEVYRGGKWRKWLLYSSPEDKFLCALIAGHYHFSSENYQRMISELEKRENIIEGIIQETMKIIEHYQQKLEESPSKVIPKPWGQEELLEVNNHYMLKRLTMLEGKRCSLQYHNKKRETIYVLSGRLKIYLGENKEYLKEIILSPGQSITIETGKIHRMEGVTDAVYLESSTPELDDVVRIEDDYHRE
jgi:mannose-6-phosphate isomerase-like protein (cupin superfamily)